MSDLPLPGDLQHALARVTLAVFDFDGVFTDNAVYVSQDGSEFIRCWRGDGIGLSQLRARGIETLVVSTETNPVVGVRSAKLGVTCRQGCTDKLAELESIWRASGNSPETTLFVGNDINDLEVLREVAVPIVVADAHPDVLGVARYRTEAPGGHGAVREVCDLVVRCRDAVSA